VVAFRRGSAAKAATYLYTDSADAALQACSDAKVRGAFGNAISRSLLVPGQIEITALTHRPGLVEEGTKLGHVDEFDQAQACGEAYD
jgi:hypothetical protein